MDEQLETLIPTKVLGRLISGIARLVSAPVDYATAWTDRWIGDVKSGTEARRLTHQGLARAVAEGISKDKSIVASASKLWIPAEVRRANNKMAVAERVVKTLQQDETQLLILSSQPDAPLDEDVLNQIERFSEEATSEFMRVQWANVLIRSCLDPESFSKTTVRLINELDADLVMDLREVAGHCFGANVICSMTGPSLIFDALVRLEGAGLAHSVGRQIEVPWHSPTDGIFIIGGRDYALVCRSETGIANLPTLGILTKAGQQMLPLIKGFDESVKGSTLCNAMVLNGVRCALYRWHNRDPKTVVTSDAAAWGGIGEFAPAKFVMSPRPTYFG